MLLAGMRSFYTDPSRLAINLGLTARPTVRGKGRLDGGQWRQEFTKQPAPGAFLTLIASHRRPRVGCYSVL
jgi:hypothetical protein